MAVWSAAMAVFVIACSAVTMLSGKSIIYESMVRMYQSAVVLPVLWLAILVGAPVGEEIFFRGFVLHGLQRSRIGTAAAVMLVSAAWAGTHVQYDLWGMGEVFLTGIFLGYARVKTGSVLLCIFLHSLMNLIATVELVVFLSCKG
jgi:membrane protease YdiL (CAAX protease family)